MLLTVSCPARLFIASINAEQVSLPLNRHHVMRQLPLEVAYLYFRLDKRRPYPYDVKWLNSTRLCTVLPLAECG